MSTRVRALFLDIDNTLCRPRTGIPDPPAYRGHTVLAAMIDAAVESGVHTQASACAVVDAVMDGIRWWHWTDFIRALGLVPHRFWDDLYERERRILEPVEPGIGDHLGRIVASGWQVFMTSNNPSSGMCHKMRIAGIAEIWGTPLVRQYLSPCDLRFMKEERGFWDSVLAHTGLDPDRVTVVGDNPHDDVSAPAQAGIRSALLYAPSGRPAGLPEDVPSAATWAEIADRLTARVEASE